MTEKTEAYLGQVSTLRARWHRHDRMKDVVIEIPKKRHVNKPAYQPANSVGGNR